MRRRTFLAGLCGVGATLSGCSFIDRDASGPPSPTTSVGYGGTVTGTTAAASGPTREATAAPTDSPTPTWTTTPTRTPTPLPDAQFGSIGYGEGSYGGVAADE